jgi:hypothetical protein
LTRKDRNLFASFVALLLLSMIFLPSMAAVPAEPHNADAMWIEPSQNAFSPSNASVGYMFNITVWLNITSADVFGYQVALHYNRTQLKATRSGFTAKSTSDFMTGHSTQQAGPDIDTSSLGNGSVLAFESCKGDDFIAAPHLGSLIWIEFQIILAPSSGQTLTSTFDITTETAKDKNWVQDFNLVPITLAVSDGFYTFTSGAPPPVGFTLTIAASVGGTTNPAPGAHVYPQGQSVSVQAIPDSGYSFDHWQLDGANVGSANPYAVTMNSNHTLSAVFSINNYTLTITASTGGSTNPVPGSYNYTYNTNAQVTAIPDANFILDHWELDGANVGATNPYTVTMKSSHTLKAVFVSSLPPSENPYDLNGPDGRPDGQVDGYDLIVIGKAFGSYGPGFWAPGSAAHPRWNPIADVNKDNKIDGVDLAIECRHFGE